jgi:hypothetical protein
MFTDVLEECATSIVRLEEKSKRGNRGSEIVRGNIGARALSKSIGAGRYAKECGTHKMVFSKQGYSGVEK